MVIVIKRRRRRCQEAEILTYGCVEEEGRVIFALNLFPKLRRSGPIQGSP